MSTQVDIAILTEAQFLNPTNPDWYINQVLLEDNLIMEAFALKGFTSKKMDWSDKSADWSQYKAVVFRSIWDYFHRYEEFCSFLKRVEGQTLFVNPISQIEWNMDKHYLIELQEKGIPIVDSHFIEAGSKITLEKLHENLGLSKSVLKPCVSGGGRHTYLLEPSNYSEHEAIFQKVISKEAMILQAFQEQIVIGGTYTHSVLKRAKEGDYRVQDDFGGSVHEYLANIDEIEFAEKVARSCEPLPAYARIDVIWDNKDNMVISEVELIEPELWFRECPKSANLLADNIIHQLRIS
jgi:hypothetical protein